MSDHDPYSTPESQLTAPTTPDEYHLAHTSSRRLRVAGCLAIVSLSIGIPYIAWSFRTPPPAGSAFEALAWSSTLLAALLMLLLLTFIKSRFKAVGVDKYVYMMIALSIGMGVLGSMAGDPSETGFSSWDIAIFASFPIYGIVLLLFGLRLRQLDPYFKYLNSFAMITIVSGGMLITVVFAVLAVVLGLVWDLYLALLFFHAANEIDTHKAKAQDTSG